MPIFARGVPKDKLTILFFVQSFSADITKEQLWRAMTENNCMTYFDFQNAVYELEEDAFLAAVPRAFGQCFRVTAQGEKLLCMFAESLPFSLRNALSDYADKNRERMRTETQLTSSMQPLGKEDGTYGVTLSAQENDGEVLSVCLRVASRDMAQRIRANWTEAAAGIYSYLLSVLLPDAAANPTDNATTEDDRSMP